MKENPSVWLSNGSVCYLTSETMLTVAKYLRWEIFKRKQYLRPGFELRSDDTIIDIGGNIGMFVLWAAPQVPQGRLLSVEPDPAALECLRLNVDRNNLRNVTILPAAAGGGDGIMELVHHPGWEAMTHSTAVNPPWFLSGSQVARLSRWLLQRSMNHAHDSVADRRIAVQQMTLARIMDLHQVSTVNYLKMDCEGSEFEILRSIDPAHWARIERVVLEYHDFGPDRKHGELVEVLRNNGFDVEVIHSLFAYCVGVRLGFIWAKKPMARSRRGVDRCDAQSQESLAAARVPQTAMRPSLRRAPIRILAYRY